MDATITERIIRVLARAAANEGMLPYVRFHAMFERTVPLTERYRALEAAVRSLGDVASVDYGVLLACDNGLPGIEFFQRFRKYRAAEYAAVVGAWPVSQPTMKQKRAIASMERARVYEHARERAEKACA
ncbi:hypothetical protein BGLT_06578 [Caballeronia glathei]|jgi:hypothetical protein|uniref:Uncharacterized protein n=1 Tax=Caballeronia glathei TaxID=60547 RepID=A0A069PDX2_9BURK|nr:hypothetical protein [Caballeronia glathei]KDR38009.1 hypothetical protein BG61_04565 [Caballeronia glathei]CDY77773.1 hypothetical protein BGLT_06578 [Caballeronia glathei]